MAMSRSLLAEFRRKRNFSKTSEPRGKPRRSGRLLNFVVQKHRASHLHYDFRLELAGVLKSWVLPKGPSLNPRERRLAVQTEDHPYEYRNFEGTIPPGQYGAGEVIVWDRGRYRPSDGGGEEAVARGLRRGLLSFELRGRKLKGGYSLVRFKRPRQWLLIKRRDAAASKRDVTRDIRSVKSTRRLHDKKPQRRTA
jgi:bifunctional non-homologous end joining protein LigD